MRFLLIVILFFVSNCRNYNTHQKIFINAIGNEKQLVQDAIDDINNSLGCNFILYYDGVGLKKELDNFSVLSFEDEVKSNENEDVIGINYTYQTTSYNDIVINRVRLNKETLNYNDKKSIIQHEIGHLLGFKHDDKWNNIMSSHLVSRFWMSQKSIDEAWNDFIFKIKISFPDMCEKN